MASLEELERDDALPRIYVDIRITRRIRSLPPMTVAIWQAMKKVLFLGAILLAALALSWPEFEISQGLGIAASIMIVWQVWENMIARSHYGVSHILLTTKGILFTAENVYVHWEDVEEWAASGDLLRLTPAPRARPGGLFAPSTLDIPLAHKSRRLVLEVFRREAPRNREAGEAPANP